MTAHIHITGPAAMELKKVAKRNKRSTVQEGQVAVERYLSLLRTEKRVADEAWAERKGAGSK